MSKYKGLFTFDEDNHGYIPIAQADGIIDTMDYEPDSKPDSKPSEPLIKDEKIRKAVRAWAELLGIKTCMYDKTLNALAVGTLMINFPNELRSEMPQKEEFYTIAELCGEEEE